MRGFWNVEKEIKKKKSKTKDQIEMYGKRDKRKSWKYSRYIYFYSWNVENLKREKWRRRKGALSDRKQRNCRISREFLWSERYVFNFAHTRYGQFDELFLSRSPVLSPFSPLPQSLFLVLFQRRSPSSLSLERNSFRTQLRIRRISKPRREFDQPIRPTNKR